MGTMVLSLLVIFTAASDLFKTRAVIDLPVETRMSVDKDWTDWEFACIDDNGERLVYINADRKRVEVLALAPLMVEIANRHDSGEYTAFHFTTADIEKYNPAGLVSLAAANGRARDEVSLPIAVNFGSDGSLLVSDAGKRRVLVMNDDYSVRNAFYLVGLQAAPNALFMLAAGQLLAVGLSLDNSSRFNEGYYCTFLNSDGYPVHSFAYSPAIVREKNLLAGVSAVSDWQADSSLYVCFNVDGRIRRYDAKGNEVAVMAPPVWFVTPARIEEWNFTDNSEPPDDFFASWTRIIKLVALPDNRLLIVALTNGLVPGVSSRFIMDIMKSSGEVLVSGITSDNLPIGCDNRNRLYWYSRDGKQLLVTSLPLTGAR